MLDLSNCDRAFIIAEAGTCHAAPEADKRFRKAQNYVFAAGKIGADAIKFQMFDNTELFCPYLGDEQRAARWSNSCLRLNDWGQIKEFAEACGMVFLASVFQDKTVWWLKKLEVEATKVASRAAAKFPYGKAQAPFLISMGMEYPTRDDAIYLECEAKYPSTAKWCGREESAAARTIARREWAAGGIGDTGFSDHSGNPWRAIDAISRGCKLIEVHFYIEPLDAGPDLPASLNLDQLKTVCEARDAFAELRRDT